MSALELDLAPGADVNAVLDVIAGWELGDKLLVGLGSSLVRAAGAAVPGLRMHPHHAGPGFDVPSTPSAIWLRVLGADRGEILHKARRLVDALGPGVKVERVVDTFTYRGNQDLSGYEDGTENPTGEDAAAAALVAGEGPGLDGGSFVAVQQWIHHMGALEAMSQEQRDHTIGRRQSDNEELEDAPASAHVKRTAQEGFSPEAFVVRRSMPWTDGRELGLLFIAFGCSFYAYEAQLRRMVGEDDGICDGLFTFTRPVSGAFYWCPPLRGGRLDLRALGR